MYRFHFSLLSVLVLAALMLGACSPPSLTPTPAKTEPAAATLPAAGKPVTSTATHPVVSPVSPPSSSDIQPTLDLLIQALNQNQPQLLDQVVDPANLPFKRLVRSRFDAFQESWRAGARQPALRVEAVEAQPHGYYQAMLTAENGLSGAWTFKKVGEDWLLSEPTVEELGAPVVITTTHFTFITYPWAEQVNPQLIELMEQARDEVFQKLGKAPNSAPGSKYARSMAWSGSPRWTPWPITSRPHAGPGPDRDLLPLQLRLWALRPDDRLARRSRQDPGPRIHPHDPHPELRQRRRRAGDLDERRPGGSTSLAPTTVASSPARRRAPGC